MPRSKQFLLEQIARAQRFAQAMNTEADRERFEKMAADLRTELDAAEAAEGQASVVPTASGGAATDDAADDAAAARPGPSGVDATATGRPGTRTRSHGAPNLRALNPIAVQIETKSPKSGISPCSRMAVTQLGSRRPKVRGPASFTSRTARSRAATAS
jgi:hypothetical protein